MLSSFENKKWQSNLHEHQPKESAECWRVIRSSGHILHLILSARVAFSTGLLQMMDWSCTWLFIDLADIWLSRTLLFLWITFKFQKKHKCLFFKAKLFNAVHFYYSYALFCSSIILFSHMYIINSHIFKTWNKLHLPQTFIITYF